MRSVERLDDFYTQLKEIHKTYFPDWRFTQFISNIMSFYQSDLFYVEEEKFLDKVKTYVKGLNLYTGEENNA